MTRKPFILAAGIGSALIFATSVWGASPPSRDAGDAGGARLARKSPPVTVVRDAGDATGAQLSLYASPVIVVRDSGDADAARQARHFIRLGMNIGSDGYTGDFMFRDYFRGTHFAQH
jgi:hypothetical protein